MKYPLVTPSCKEPRALGDVGIDPYADFQTALVKPLQHTGGIRKYERIPFEIYPLELAHPEAVKMENMQRQIALLHSVDKAV